MISPLFRPTRWGLLTLLGFSLNSGCIVHAYQPLSGFHRPTAVVPRARNFEGLDVTVSCVAGKMVDYRQASILCDYVTQLFENQGATVRTLETQGRFGEAVDRDGETTDGAPSLLVEISSRQLDRSTKLFSWILCVGSFTLLPGVTEDTFAQDIVIRDETGFLLVKETLKGRLIHRFGFGPWATTSLIDLTRPKEERLTKGAAERDLSTDLYLQLSQLLFNARLHSEVLTRAERPATNPLLPAEAEEGAPTLPGITDDTSGTEPVTVVPSVPDVGVAAEPQIP